MDDLLHYGAVESGNFPVNRTVVQLKKGVIDAAWCAALFCPLR